MSTPFNVGDSVRVTATFSDLTGAQADPTTVVFKTKDPNGIVSTIDATKESVGVYSADLPLTAPGIWFYRWEATGSVAAATEGQVTAKPSAFYES